MHVINANLKIRVNFVKKIKQKVLDLVLNFYKIRVNFITRKFSSRC